MSITTADDWGKQPSKAVQLSSISKIMKSTEKLYNCPIVVLGIFIVPKNEYVEDKHFVLNEFSEFDVVVKYRFANGLERFFRPRF